MGKEKKQTIFLSLILAMFVAELVLSALSSLLGEGGFFISSAVLSAIRVPSLLLFAVLITAYAIGALKQHKRSVIIRALIASFIFLGVEIALNFIGSILIYFMSNFALMEGILTTAKCALWVALFFWAARKTILEFEKTAPRKLRGVQAFILVVASLFVVAFPVIEYAVVYPALGGVTSLEELSSASNQLIEQATIGNSVTIQVFQGVELASWWLLSSACAWVSWQTLEDSQ